MRTFGSPGTISGFCIRIALCALSGTIWVLNLYNPRFENDIILGAAAEILAATSINRPRADKCCILYSPGHSPNCSLRLTTRRYSYFAAYSLRFSPLLFPIAWYHIKS